MKSSLTIDESAAYLGTSRCFVQSMIDKGRLTINDSGLIEASQVEALDELVKKLKKDGFTAMVSSLDAHL